MKKTLFLLILFIGLSPSIYSQVKASDEYICSGNRYDYYSTSKIRKVNGFYYAWIHEQLMQEKTEERKELAKLFNNQEFMSFSYILSLYAFDCNNHMYKDVKRTYYSYNGESLFSFSFKLEEEGWKMPNPDSIMESIVEYVAKTVQDNESLSKRKAK